MPYVPAVASTLFRIKPVGSFAVDAAETGLRRTMGRWSLLALSVGSIVGTGIFVILGQVVPKAGPAVTLAFVGAALAAGLSALAYAELASTVPAAGSSYSYAYATLGEIVAWAVGWMLMLEYGVSVAAVAVGFGQYLGELLSSFGISLPAEFMNGPGEGGTLDIPAAAIVVLCGVLLIRGASESAKVNLFMVSLKVGILVLFCAVAFTAFNAGNLTPFLPLGVAGITAAAGQVFFSYIGFDAASTASEEAKNPSRDLPFAIIGSLIVVTVLYLLVAVAALGAVPWQSLEGSGGEAVLSKIARTASGSEVAPVVIAAGALISIFSVVLVTLYGQTRILMAMSRDGMIPRVFSRIDRRRGTPMVNTVIVTSIIAVVAALVPLGNLAEATSIGTIGAFIVVNIGVIVLRYRDPDRPRPFRAPLFPFTPIAGSILLIVIALGLDIITWGVFIIWMVVGFAIYFGYSRRHSVLGRQEHLLVEADAALLTGRADDPDDQPEPVQR